MILDTYIIGGNPVYGLLISEGHVLHSTRADYTRYYFARKRQAELIIELAKRLSNQWQVNGIYAKKILSKINQCSRIMDYYNTPTIGIDGK